MIVLPFIVYFIFYPISYMMFRKQFRVSKEDSVFFTIIWPLFLFAIILAYIIYIVVSFLEKIWECVKDYLP